MPNTQAPRLAQAVEAFRKKVCDLSGVRGFDNWVSMKPRRAAAIALVGWYRWEEKIIMCRLSIAAIAFGLLLTEGCMSQHMAALQQQCGGGDRNACEQVRAPLPRCTDQPAYCTPGLPLAPFDENASAK